MTENIAVYYIFNRSVYLFFFLIYFNASVNTTHVTKDVTITTDFEVF